MLSTTLLLASYLPILTSLEIPRTLLESSSPSIPKFLRLRTWVSNVSPPPPYSLQALADCDRILQSAPSTLSLLTRVRRVSFFSFLLLRYNSTSEADALEYFNSRSRIWKGTHSPSKDYYRTTSRRNDHLSRRSCWSGSSRRSLLHVLVGRERSSYRHRRLGYYSRSKVSRHLALGCFQDSRAQRYSSWVSSFSRISKCLPGLTSFSPRRNSHRYDIISAVSILSLARALRILLTFFPTS